MISRHLQKTAAKLFPDRVDEFVAAFLKPSAPIAALVWLQERPEPFPFSKIPTRLPLPPYVDLVPDSDRPGRHELHEKGAYYSLDYSSVFAAQVYSAIPSAPNLIVDVCSSPGGKGIMAWRHFSPQQLVCNEVIGKRLGALSSNLKRCGLSPSPDRPLIRPSPTFSHEGRRTNVVVDRRDPSVLSETYQDQADLVIVDAPCSGQSLYRGTEKTEGAFHPVMINKNRSRQRRILAEASKIVRDGGYLAYMTCTFSREENEDNATWFLKKFPTFKPVFVSTLEKYQSHLADFPCYRLWPFESIGKGSFVFLAQRNKGREPSSS